MNEDVELSLGAKVRMLRGYLGQFYVTVPLDKRKLFSESIPNKGMTVYAEGSDLALKELGAWVYCNEYNAKVCEGLGGVLHADRDG